MSEADLLVLVMKQNGSGKILGLYFSSKWSLDRESGQIELMFGLPISRRGLGFRPI